MPSLDRARRDALVALTAGVVVAAAAVVAALILMRPSGQTATPTHATSVGEATVTVPALSATGTNPVAVRPSNAVSPTREAAALAIPTRGASAGQAELAVPDGWVTVAVPIADVAFDAVSPQRDAEETLRRGTTFLPVADSARALQGLLRAQHPDAVVTISQGVSVQGANEAWLIECSYVLPANSQRINRIDILAHGDRGDDAHLILEGPPGTVNDPLAQVMVQQLRLVPPAVGTASPPRSP